MTDDEKNVFEEITAGVEDDIAAQERARALWDRCSEASGVAYVAKRLYDNAKEYGLPNDVCEAMALDFFRTETQPAIYMIGNEGEV
ncbi:hypothetical protein [Streptomyces sp. NPDC002644]